MKWDTPWKIKRRTVRRFAWLPVTLTNGIGIWLEYYWSTEVWTAWPGDCHWSCESAWQDEITRLKGGGENE